MRLTQVFGPVRQASFRWLWAGMGLSYAGDRLQELAQGWLVVVVTGSAVAVSGIAVLASIPQLLMPLGGVIADLFDRRQLIMVVQLVGAVLTALMAVLVWRGWIALWHIYAWAILAGTAWMVIRPAYKVVLTECVPVEQTRQAVSLNSMTETSAMVLSNAGGGALVGWLGLPVAFAANSLSYLVAATCLWRMKSIRGSLSRPPSTPLSFRQVLSDLRAGFVYLVHQPQLFYPLLLTLATTLCLAPLSTLLPVLVRQQGGTVTTLGLLGGLSSLGCFLGAVYGGSRSEGRRPLLIYGWFGIAAAVSVGLYVAVHQTWLLAAVLPVVGFTLFAEAVWNTSRVRVIAHPGYQARMQSLTTLAFTLGGAIGALWGGVALDHFGLPALLGGVAMLALVSIMAILIKTRDSAAV